MNDPRVVGSRKDRLLRAARALDSVIEELGEESVRCETCAHLHYANPEEFRAATTLKAMAAKVKRLAHQDWAKVGAAPAAPIDDADDPELKAFAAHLNGVGR